MSDNADRAAYPTEWNDLHNEQRGLSKREYFAGLAMQGLLANPYYAAETGTTGTIESAAVYHADALLAALEAK